MHKFMTSSSRTNKAKLQIIYMFLIKACNILINLAYVPLLIHSLNQEKYGIWLTITTIVSWIAFFDIGLGNGLRNKLAESVAQNNDKNAKEYVSTTYTAMGCLCLLFIIIELCIVPLCDWGKLLNAQSISNNELTVLMLWVLSSLCFQMFFKLITSILYALQRPALSSLILMLSQLLAFIGVLAYSKLSNSVSLLQLGKIISLAPVVILVLSSFFLFKYKIPQYTPSIKYFDTSKVKEVVILGSKFFSIQLTTLLLFQSNNFIIAHTCGSSSVAEYNIAHKYIGLIEMAFAIIATPFWSAATDAYAKRDYAWIKSILKKLGIIEYTFICIGIILILISDYTYVWWLSSSIKPDKTLMLLLLVYFTIQLSWIRYGNIINGIGYIKLQFIITLSEAIIHIPLAIILSSIWGLKGILLSLIATTFVNTIWPRFQIKNIFSGKHGIWTK